MIKINIENPDDFENDYCNKVLNSVKERIDVYKITVDHLLGGRIDVNNPKLVKFKATTRNTINIIEGLSIEESFFLKNNYESTLITFLKTSKKLKTININGINNLLNFLLDNGNDELKKLLLCKPENLKKKNDSLLGTFNLNGIQEKTLLKLAFSYDDSSISDRIKDFFRTNNHVKICPYCNLLDTKHRPTPVETIAMYHELDHFYDQANHSLLSCSMYNLIPCDSICNGSANKGSTIFNDKYYLNPYISGFQNSISFRPINISLKYDVEKIVLDVNESNNTRLIQLLGRDKKINEGTKEGNINVFRLESKYSDRNEEASKILKKIKNNYGSILSLKKMLGLMNLNYSINSYIRWYELYIGTSFDEKKFGEKEFSKFNRDIHDYYYKKDKKNFTNKYIRNLIKN